TPPSPRKGEPLHPLGDSWGTPPPPIINGHPPAGRPGPPSPFDYAFFSSLREAELIQYRRPVGAGPSSNTCPRWASQALHSTSVRRIQKLSSSSLLTFSSEMGAW